MLHLYQENKSYGIETIALILCLHVAVHHDITSYTIPPDKRVPHILILSVSKSIFLIRIKCCFDTKFFNFVGPRIVPLCRCCLCLSVKIVCCMFGVESRGKAPGKNFHTERPFLLIFTTVRIVLLLFIFSSSAD
jgi:hypothetical protein